MVNNVSQALQGTCVSTTGHISTEPWVKSLEASGTLARERGEYGQELERLGMPEQEARQIASLYIPDPKFIGQAKWCASEFYRLRQLISRPGLCGIADFISPAH